MFKKIIPFDLENKAIHVQDTNLGIGNLEVNRLPWWLRQ